MGESSVSARTDEFLDFVAVLIQYRSRVLATLPEEALKHKERLERLRLNDGSRRTTGINLYFRVGMMLTRQKGPLPMGEFSKGLDIPLSTATRIMDGLVEEGLAERVSDPEDRRVVRVALTDEGRTLFQSIYGHIRERVSEFLLRLSAEEQEQLIFLLRKALGDLHESDE